MKASNVISELAQALVIFQGELPRIAKEGKSHHGKFITLDSIIETIQKPLTANGLSFVQMPTFTENGPGLTTRLMHKSGEWLEDTMPVFGTPNQNEAQSFGGGLTYARRYALTAMLGIAADEDTDGNGNKQQPRQPAQRKAPPTSPSAPGPTWEDLDQHSQGKALHPVIADLRAKLESLAKDGTIKIGLVCDHAVMAKVGYGQANQPLNALKNEEAGYPLPDGVELEWKMATVVKTPNGLKLFDWLIERKAEST